MNIEKFSLPLENRYANSYSGSSTVLTNLSFLRGFFLNATPGEASAIRR